MKVQNSKTQTPSGVSLNDKDYMNIMLTHLKELVKNYAIMLTEASNENLLKKEEKVFDKLLDLQRKTYNIMFQNGWYSLESQDSTKINNKYEMLNQEYTDLFSE